MQTANSQILLLCKFLILTVLLRFKTAPFFVSKQAGGHDAHAGGDINAILVFCASSFIAPAGIGTESLAEELRLRTCVELIRNKRSYQSHPDASTLRMLSSTATPSTIAPHRTDIRVCGR